MWVGASRFFWPKFKGFKRNCSFLQVKVLKNKTKPNKTLYKHHINVFPNKNLAPVLGLGVLIVPLATPSHMLMIVVVVVVVVVIKVTIVIHLVVILKYN